MSSRLVQHPPNGVLVATRASRSPKEAEAGHLAPHHAAHAGAAVDAHAQLHRLPCAGMGGSHARRWKLVIGVICSVVRAWRVAGVASGKA